MNVEMPDGTVIEDVPDGMTQAELLRRYSKLRAPEPEKAAPSPTAQMARAALSGFPGLQYAPDLFMGMRSIPDAGAQLLTRGLEAVAPAGSAFEGWAKGQREKVEGVNKQAQDAYRQQYDPENTTGAGVARSLGAALATGPALAVVGPAATIGGRAAQGVATGAAQGALTPVEPGQDFWSEKAKQAGIGAAVGGAATFGADALGRMLAPKTSANVKKMMDEGVTPTPGQILGGAWKRAEEGSASIPLYGEAVKAGQRRAIEEFNRAEYGRILRPLGPQAEEYARKLPVGNEGIAKVGDALSDAYQSALAKAAPSPLDRPFLSAINKVHGMVPSSLQDDFAKSIKSAVEVTPGGTITPSVFKSAESELGRLARQYRGSQDGSQRELARAFAQAQQELRDLMARTNPTIAPQIQAINRGWASLTQLETAAASVGAKEGVITPAQLLNAVKRSDSSVRDRAFARGEARNQDFAKAADETLSKRVPDSGTPFRTMLGAIGAGGLGFVNPAAPILAGTAALAYTPAGQKAIAGLLTKRPELMRLLGGQLGESSPYLAAPFTAGLLGP